MSAGEHIQDASTCIAASSEIQSWTIEERLVFATRAQASATLALVEEQRTANLIAYLASANREKVAYPVPLEVMKHLQAQIDVRLGLA